MNAPATANVASFYVRSTGKVSHFCQWCWKLHAHDGKGKAQGNGGLHDSLCTNPDSPHFGQQYFLDVLGTVPHSSRLIRDRGEPANFRALSIVDREVISLGRAVPAFLLIDGEGNNRIRYWCDWCRSNHKHGAAGEGLEGGGYRCSHCDNPASPHRRENVYLVMRGTIIDPKTLAPRNKTFRVLESPLEKRRRLRREVDCEFHLNMERKWSNETA